MKSTIEQRFGTQLYTNKLKLTSTLNRAKFQYKSANTHIQRITAILFSVLTYLTCASYLIRIRLRCYFLEIEKTSSLPNLILQHTTRDLCCYDVCHKQSVDMSNPTNKHFTDTNTIDSVFVQTGALNVSIEVSSTFNKFR